MLYNAFYHSPFGCFEIRANAHSLTQVCLVQGEIVPPEDYLAAPDIVQEAVAQLSEYFHRQRKKFDLPLDFSSGTAFHQQVWKALQEIPYGHTTSYSAIAKKVEHPEAVRAVGMANRSNPFAIVVPCHRVIAKDGDLQGYFYGLDMKRRLLELENPLSFGQQGSLF